jgi:hypothetical protein
VAGNKGWQCEQSHRRSKIVAVKKQIEIARKSDR